MDLLLATRSLHKVQEIRKILAHVPGIRILDLNDAGIPYDPREEDIEQFDTFEENARAKASYFFKKTGFLTLADDSGLEVDPLGGAPGVRSKRFAPEDVPFVDGEARDRENNEHLLRLLGDLELAQRTARYVCVAALALEGGEVRLFRGESPGLILGRPRGWGGFGYDPLFFDQKLGKTFAEITPEEKNERSHRGRAFQALADDLSYLVGGTRS